MAFACLFSCLKGWKERQSNSNRSTQSVPHSKLRWCYPWWNFSAGVVLCFWGKTSSFGIITESVAAGVGVCVWGSVERLTSYTPAGVLLCSRRVAMPRSFLVKSKRAHLLRSSKSFSRRHSQSVSSIQPVQQATRGERRCSEYAVQPVTPMFGGKDPLDEARSPWDGGSVQSHRGHTVDLWPAGK